MTVGKRATLWCLELVLDLREIERRVETLPFLGVKGTTGTQAGFSRSSTAITPRSKQLDHQVAASFGFAETSSVSGQTYTRKIDTQVLNSLSGLAESAHRFGTDLRLLAHDREIEEPLEAEQVGSSAMAYKRNPMRAERMCSLGRFLMGLPAIAAQTAATQWLERTLDDSAARRLILPQAFLAADALLRLYLNVVPGMVVNTKTIDRRVLDELPFMATENILMAGVKAGGDRQALHERIRSASLAAAERVKSGEHNDLIGHLRDDESFRAVDFDAVLDPRAYIGLRSRASRRVSAKGRRTDSRTISQSARPSERASRLISMVSIAKNAGRRVGSRTARGVDRIGVSWSKDRDEGHTREDLRALFKRLSSSRRRRSLGFS